MFSPNRRRNPLTQFPALCVLACAFGAAPTARAQSAMAALGGTVTDEQGAVVPGAVVSVTDAARAFTRQTTTNDEGRFNFAQLQPSAYVVRAERGGFSPAELPGVVLNVGEQRSLQITLRVGAVGEAVTVQASLVD